MISFRTYDRAFDGSKVDPYPVEVLKRVDHPTTLINEGEIQRMDERESGFKRGRGYLEEVWKSEDIEAGKMDIASVLEGCDSKISQG